MVERHTQYTAPERSAVDHDLQPSRCPACGLAPVALLVDKVMFVFECPAVCCMGTGNTLMEALDDWEVAVREEGDA